MAASVSQVRVVNSTLSEFCRASGLKVSIAKSKAMCSKGVPQPRCRRLSIISNIQMVNQLDKYLGIPLLFGRIPRKQDFNFILDKLNQKLASWQQKLLLNRAGRITLVKSVKTALPNYGMHSMWLPQSVCDYIDASARRFIWKGNEGKGPLGQMEQNLFA